jgi:hypothetical protein
MPESNNQTPPATTPPPDTVDVNAEIAKAQAQWQKDLEAATGHKSLDALKEQQLKDKGDLQALLDSKSQEADGYKNKFQSTLVHTALLSASADALDSEVIHDLLANKAAVDSDGNVTVDGKPVKEAVANLLKAKPFLAKASGNTGSGTQQTGITSPPSNTANLSPVERMNLARSQGVK